MESIAIFFLQAIIGGIAGNRADNLTMNGYKKILNQFRKVGEPVNHDIERAIRKSYLLATIVVCNASLVHKNSNFRWRSFFLKNIDDLRIREYINNFELELKQIDKPNYQIKPVNPVVDTSLLLQPNGEAVQDRIGELKASLHRQLLFELGSICSVPCKLED